MRTIFLLLCLCGCMANNTLATSGMSSDNVSNLARLAVGMDRSQVLQIMRQPYSKETYTIGSDQDTYDVWFYVTRTTVLGQSRMVPLNLTPLTFKNGSLVGWGYSHYYHIFKQPEEKGKPAKEDTKLEKALSMSKPPKKSSEDDDETPLDERDRRMLEEADEQNFDYW